MEIYGVTYIVINILVCVFALLLIVISISLILVLTEGIVHGIKECIRTGKQKI